MALFAMHSSMPLCEGRTTWETTLGRNTSRVVQEHARTSWDAVNSRFHFTTSEDTHLHGSAS